jgi:glycosyltransferase involved in cell wall biosynthesis
MVSEKPLNIGIACYPTVGGSGVLASALGEELVRRGHEVHFFSYERPFRLPQDVPRLHFHRVEVNDYGLFKYPDYTLPLSVKMAEVSRHHRLDLLHVHYAVPHATAAILARAMLPAEYQQRIVTTHMEPTPRCWGGPWLRGGHPARFNQLRRRDRRFRIPQAETQRLWRSNDRLKLFTASSLRRGGQVVRAWKCDRNSGLAMSWCCFTARICAR